MLIKFIEKLFKNIYDNNLQMQLEHKHLKEKSKIKVLGDSKIAVKFRSYYGKNFTVNIPEGYKVTENSRTGSIVITKNFYDYDFSYNASVFKSYIHILISKLSLNLPLYSEDMEYEYMKEFIMKSPAFKNLESEDIYIGNRLALSIRSSDIIYSGQTNWVMIPYKKELFNIRITAKETSQIDIEIIKEIIQSFNISPKYGENKALYNSTNNIYKYNNIDIEKGYISKTDAI